MIIDLYINHMYQLDMDSLHNSKCLLDNSILMDSQSALSSEQYYNNNQLDMLNNLTRLKKDCMLVLGNHFELKLQLR